MNEQFRENPENEKDKSYEAIITAMEKQRITLEKINEEQRKDNPDTELLKTLMEQMEEANKEAGIAWSIFKKSMENSHEQEVAGE